MDTDGDFPIIPHANEPYADECCGCLFPIGARRRNGVGLQRMRSCRSLRIRGCRELRQRFFGDPTKVPKHICPNCGALNTFPQFDEVVGDICQRCESAVSVRPMRPLPDRPRCRGIELPDGNFTGCAYGYGDCEPFTGPCDCPTCNGSGIEQGYQAN